MRRVCANCGDTIEEVDEDYEPGLFERFSVEKGEKIVLYSGTRCCGGSD